ncbi:MAG: hypothetical protein HQL80_02645 [Magnetococcales bacterium]|nr:hypothetical protein [Magnetococcales bacterium]
MTETSAAAQAKIRAGTRIERSNKKLFDDRLITVSHVELDKSVADMPRIRVEIHHFGSRAVDDARLDLLFLDSKNQVLGRRAVNPLVVAGSLYGDQVKPLRPGEIREFFIDASQPPAGWLNNVAAEIVYYRFAP